MHTIDAVGSSPMGTYWSFPGFFGYLAVFYTFSSLKTSNVILKAQIYRAFMCQ